MKQFKIWKFLFIEQHIPCDKILLVAFIHLYPLWTRVISHLKDTSHIEIDIYVYYKVGDRENMHIQTLSIVYN
ncbi:hypothetical protein Scep_002632 [Stephania cephalantha]|uniref:Uncharacterized protein n=1 Tax=Stephania cephalantha TaxID=152367 RepID=A0AAP0Q8Y9_9MAGN